MRGPASQWMIWFVNCGAERGAFIDEDAGGRAAAGLEQIRHDAGIVQMPVRGAGFRVSMFVRGVCQPAPVISSVKP